jgi:NADP-dependent alcohol dehydrogenase
VRPDRRALVEIARLGGLSHLDEMHAGRDPFAARGWYLANELSVALGLRKTQAVAALLPHLWRAIALGDARLGSAPRLRRMWRAIRRVAVRPLPDDPVPGVVRLLDAWGVRRALAPGDDDRVALAARRAVRSWGGGLPMLAGLRRGEIHTLLARAAAGLPA